jgi:glutaminyl-tRNA synthetase
MDNANWFFYGSFVFYMYALMLFHSINFFFVFSIHNPGYFVVDKDSTPERLVFNRTVTLRDSYGKSGK